MRKDEYPKPETETVEIQLDSEIANELENLAETEDTSLSTVLNQSAVVYLAVKKAEGILEDYGYEYYGETGKWDGAIGLITKFGL